MIAPEFRSCNSPDLNITMKKFIEANHGSDLWTACSDGINNAKKIKDEVRHATNFKTDPE